MNQQINTPETYFCNFDVVNEPELVTRICLLVASIGLLTIAARQYLKLRLMKCNRNVHRVFGLIFVWWLLSAVKDAISISTYAINTDNSCSPSVLQSYSKSYFIFDISVAFILQTILLMVCAFWISSISTLLFPVDSQATEDTLLPRTLQCKMKVLLRLYKRIRLFGILLMGAFILVQGKQALMVFVRILLFALLVDCIILIASLIGGLYSLHNSKISNIIESTELDLMRNQFLVILLCSVFRLVPDILTLIQSYVAIFGKSLFEASCSTQSEFTAGGYLKLLFTSGFTHYVPIIMVLRIYHIEDDQAAQFLNRSFLQDDSS